jgi:hypothetical protein
MTPVDRPVSSGPRRGAKRRRVVTCLEGDSLKTLRRACVEHFALAVYAPGASLLGALSRGDADVLVFDPTGLREDVFAALLSTVRECGVGVLLFTPLTRSSAVRALQVARVVPAEVCLKEAVNSDRLLRLTLEEMDRASVPALVLYELAGHLQTTSPELASSLVTLFAGGRIANTAAAFARPLSAHRRTIERGLTRGRVESVRTMLVVARLARTWAPLNLTALTLEDVAKIAGYGTVRRMSSHYQALIGLSPRRAVANLSTQDFASRLAAAALRAVAGS